MAARISLPLLCLALTADARSFYSRDRNVRKIIETCNSAAHDPQQPHQTQCQASLQCILSAVDPYRSARWSAGASILAFIPTIVGLMSNSIDEVVLAAEESPLLAYLLCLCTVTTFTSRFGERRTDDYSMSKEAVLSSVERQLDELRKKVSRVDQSRASSLLRTVSMTLLPILLAACAVAVWYSIAQITTYGVVVFACSIQLNPIIWAGVTQVVCISSLWLRRYTIQCYVVKLQSRSEYRKPDKADDRRVFSRLLEVFRGNSQLGSSGSTGTLVLRSFNDSMVAQGIRLGSSVLSFCLYAFGTAILAGMTMVPASDSIRVMVLIAASAGIGRMVGIWATAPRGRWRKVVVIDVPYAHYDWLVEKMEHQVAAGNIAFQTVPAGVPLRP